MDVLRESRQAAPNTTKGRTSPKNYPQSQTNDIRFLAWTSSNLAGWNTTHACQCLNQCESCTSLFMPLYHFSLIAEVKMFAAVLVARWRTRAFSRWGILRPALRIEGIHKLIASWSSFIAHPTMDNACVCLLKSTRTVVAPKNCLEHKMLGTQTEDLHLRCITKNTPL